jgi:dTDP-4-amino-4,6-dideoxygalactose transaminase
MNVNVFDLERDHQEIKGELVRIFEEVLSSGGYILGTHVSEFEKAFARYIGVKHAVGVGNGTDAIRIGGLALGLKAGDKLVTTPDTYIATTMALSVQGITPVFCDVEPGGFNMDPARLEEVLKKDGDVKLCIPVHLYGHPARMDEILTVTKRYGARVLEDCAQAHGALYKGKKTGSLGDAAAFSFYPTKNLGGYGDGGLVATDSDEVYERIDRLRNFGQEGKHVHVSEGFNSRLDEVQAALLTYKLKSLDEANAKRRAVARLYKEALADTPLGLPREEEYGFHVYHLFVIRSKEREALMAHLKGKGVTTIINYPIPIHLQKVYRHLGYGEGSFPEAEKAAREIITLPMYPSLREDEVLYICDAIRAFYGMSHS